jgi:uncharacterized protein involved in cysteine biosynthesis
MKYVWRAINMFRRFPRLRRFVWKPMLITMALFIGLVVALFSLLWPLLASLSLPAWLSVAAGPIATLGLGVILYLAFVPLFVTLAITINAFGWDQLSREIELLETGHAVDEHPPFHKVFVDGLRRQLVALILFPVAACSGLWFLTVIVAAYLGLHDYGAPIFYRRDVYLSGQRRLVFRQKDWLTFALAAGVSTLFPLVNILLLPVFVAGATLMFLDSRSRLGLP